MMNFDIKQFAIENKQQIENWIAERVKNSSSVFYSSCDVRYSGFKVSQVDANCFPAGFNNLNITAYTKAIECYKEYFSQNKIKNILIFPEFHTRNFGYLKNLKTIKTIFESAGAKVKVATNLEYKFNIDLSESDIKTILDEIEIKENSLEFSPISKCKWFYQKKYKIGSVEKGKKSCCFTADLVVLNNDLSAGMPDILKNLKTQILPKPAMGWHQRKKSEHFYFYNKIVEEFCKDFKLDPWFFSSIFETVENVHFKTEEGFDLIREKVQIVFEKTKEKYEEYGINLNPVVFIKSNKGTYGMGIHVIKNMEDLKTFNKDFKKKMGVIKDGVENTSLIIQEGIPTILHNNEEAMEPVYYSVLSNPIGMFFRINKGENDNLNSKGMHFENNITLPKECEILSFLVASFANIAIALEETEKIRLT